MSKASEEALNDLHGALARKLKEKIESGEVTAADLSVARQFLKDNGIEAVASPDSDLGKLATEMPFADPAAIQRDREDYH